MSIAEIKGWPWTLIKKLFELMTQITNQIIFLQLWPKTRVQKLVLRMLSQLIFIIWHEGETWISLRVLFKFISTPSRGHESVRHYWDRIWKCSVRWNGINALHTLWYSNFTFCGSITPVKLSKYFILKNQKLILNLHAAKDLNWSYSRIVSQELKI